mmetsp:Transcript_31025/g.71732  ORF Transcript_31025/g.71732 Transcript_31025/m.71732 type:complete len:409 (+) Transcript_31025:118-1344(+)
MRPPNAPPAYPRARLMAATPFTPARRPGQAHGTHTKFRAPRRVPPAVRHVGTVGTTVRRLLLVDGLAIVRLRRLLVLDHRLILLENVGPRGHLADRCEHIARHSQEALHRARALAVRPRLHLRRDGGGVQPWPLRAAKDVSVPEFMSRHVREQRPVLAHVHGPLLHARAAENTTLHHAPVLALGPVDLVDRTRIPHDHVARLWPELKLLGVVDQITAFDVHEHGVALHTFVLVRPLQVHRRTVLRRRVVHGHPPAKGVVEENRAVLVVLVPFESRVGVHHQQVRREADLLGLAQLGEDGGHGRVVLEVGERIVRRPDRALDVIVDTRRDTRRGPDVRVVNLPLRRGTEVGQPLGAQSRRDVHHAVALESFDLLLGDREVRRHAVVVWAFDLRVLHTVGVLDRVDHQLH